jgi:hypothetical protein
MAWSATHGDFPWGRFVNSTVLPLLICASCILPQTTMAAQQQGKAQELPAEIEQRVSAVCSHTDTYDCYTNHKYGFVIAWPKKYLKALGESDAGDGQSFEAPDQRANLTVWAGLNARGKKIQDLFKDAVAESGAQVTYKHLGNDSFVVSGTEDGKIFYRKTVATKDLYATFILTYDPALKEVFNPMVKDISQSFNMHPAFSYRQ